MPVPIERRHRIEGIDLQGHIGLFAVIADLILPLVFPTAGVELRLAALIVQVVVVARIARGDFTVLIARRAGTM